MADTPRVSVEVLIIACGNPMRGDDGVGPIVAERVEASLSEAERESHRVIITHQLLPEHVLELSHAKRAVLIDARVPESEPIGVVRCEPVKPEARVASEAPGSDAEAGLTHHWTFPRLLAMSALLYGCAPESTTVSVTTDDFDSPDSLSPAIQAVLPEMVDHVMRVIRGEGVA